MYNQIAAIKNYG